MGEIEEPVKTESSQVKTWHVSFPCGLGTRLEPNVICFREGMCHCVANSQEWVESEWVEFEWMESEWVGSVGGVVRLSGWSLSGWSR